MYMLEIIAKTGLFFSQTFVLACIVIVGFLNGREKIYGHALFLLLFTMIYNLFLKSIWQVPLPLPLEGWAFPSGHMHGAVVFWGWLACEYRRVWFWAVVCFILILVGYGLVYHNYHYPLDILGALGFGTGTLIIYRALNSRTFFQEKPYRMGILLAILGSIFLLLLPAGTRKPILWQSLGELIGFSIGWFLWMRVLDADKHINFSAVR